MLTNGSMINVKIVRNWEMFDLVGPNSIFGSPLFYDCKHVLPKLANNVCWIGVACRTFLLKNSKMIIIQFILHVYETKPNEYPKQSWMKYQQPVQVKGVNWENQKLLKEIAHNLHHIPVTQYYIFNLCSLSSPHLHSL